MPSDIVLENHELNQTETIQINKVHEPGIVGIISVIIFHSKRLGVVDYKKKYQEKISPTATLLQNVKLHFNAVELKS